jgi:O-antigen/teichoic acid export membrane protein
VALPIFAQKQDDLDQLRQRLFATMSVCTIVALPAFLGLSAVAPDLIPFAFGQVWTPAVPVVQLLAISALLSSISILHGAVVRATGQAGVWSAYVSVVVLVNVANYLIFSRFGLVPVAASLVWVGLLGAPVHFWLVRRTLRFAIADYLRIFYAPVASAALMYAVVSLVRGTDWFFAADLWAKVGTGIFTGATVYIVCMLAIARERVLRLLSHARGPWAERHA